MKADVQDMNVESPSVLPILRSPTQGKLLARLLEDPTRQWSVRELASHVGTSEVTAPREVRRAEQAGYVTVERVGNRRVVTADTRHVARVIEHDEQVRRLSSSRLAAQVARRADVGTPARPVVTRRSRPRRRLHARGLRWLDGTGGHRRRASPLPPWAAPTTLSRYLSTRPHLRGRLSDIIGYRHGGR